MQLETPPTAWSPLRLQPWGPWGHGCLTPCPKMPSCVWYSCHLPWPSSAPAPVSQGPSLSSHSSAVSHTSPSGPVTISISEPVTHPCDLCPHSPPPPHPLPPISHPCPHAALHHGPSSGPVTCHWSPLSLLGLPLPWLAPPPPLPLSSPSLEPCQFIGGSLLTSELLLLGPSCRALARASRAFFFS